MSLRTIVLVSGLLIIAAPLTLGTIPPGAAAGALVGLALVVLLEALGRRKARASATGPEIEPDDPWAHLRDLAAKLSEGDLTARLDLGPSGDERTVAAVNTAIGDLNAAVDEALALADVSANGDLTARATGRYRGHPGALTQALNGLLDGLSALAETLGDAVGQNESRSARMADVASTLNRRSHDQVAAFHDLAGEFDQISRGLEDVRSGAISARAAIDATVSAASLGRERIAEAVAAIARVEHGSREIDEVTELIQNVSKQSQLLSINASVEAARAGDAGRGFGIVASEMGTLGARTQEAAQRISEIARGSAVDITRSAELVAEAVKAIQRIEAASTEATSVGDEILDTTAQERERLGASRDRIETIRQEVDANLDLADTANRLADELAENANSLRTISGRFRLSDDHMIDAVRTHAEAAGAALERALRNNEISESDLFSEDYKAIEGSNPPQFMTPFVPVTDRHLSPIIETVFDIGPDIVFGAVMDRNGFLPTHSRKFSKPQGPDPVWNAANARNRRFFKDRVGLACGRSTAPHLLQVYRRDMGGGAFVTMKDISAPILVNGRQWGGFRIGYRSAEPGVGTLDGFDRSEVIGRRTMSAPAHGRGRIDLASDRSR